jgi:uncharacterized protein with HEPN domain
LNSITGSSRGAFLHDRKTQKATLRELQELAESTQRLSDEVRARRPEILWRDIAGFRNVIVHDYLGLSLDRIWEVIENDLPVLETAIEALLKEEEPP